jgi:hypothetical protein
MWEMTSLSLKLHKFGRFEGLGIGGKMIGPSNMFAVKVTNTPYYRAHSIASKYDLVIHGSNAHKVTMLEKTCSMKEYNKETRESGDIDKPYIMVYNSKADLTLNRRW